MGRFFFHCPACGSRIGRARVFFSRGGIDCPACQHELELAVWWEKLRVLPYLLVATAAMELARDRIPALARLAVILGPPALLLPFLISLKERAKRD